MDFYTQRRWKGLRDKIPLLRPYFDDEELVEIKQVLDSGWVSQGPKTKEFEQAVSDYTGAKHAIAVTNCTSALHLSLLAIGIKPGDEVLVADYTYPATGHSVVYCGAKPVFVDINPRTYNIDPHVTEEKITDMTKAIIPVHTFGQCAEMDPINELAKKHNLLVIEDGACAFGATYKGKFAGSFGDTGCYSFHARKGITTGEGGMVVTADKAIAKQVRNLSVFGIESAWGRESQSDFSIPEFVDIGFNYKMSDIIAAVGLVQLRRIDRIIKRKNELARYWDSKLEDMPLIAAPNSDPNGTHIYQSYVALVDPSISRNKLIQKLLKNGIQTQIGTYASHKQPVYKSNDECPHSLDIFNRAIALPMYFTLKEDEIDLAVSKLKVALEEMK
jgi:dTDP-4-amino-4,6-dideoxygalactose transaminase